MFAAGYVVVVECKPRNTKHLQDGILEHLGPNFQSKTQYQVIIRFWHILKCETKTFKLFLLCIIVDCNKALPLQHKNPVPLTKHLFHFSLQALFSTSIFFYWDFFCVEIRQLTKYLLTIEHGMREKVHNGCSHQETSMLQYISLHL